MGLLDKAKGSVEKVKDISLDLVSDENLANMIMAACTKQENVNEEFRADGKEKKNSDEEERTFPHS